MPQRKNRQPRSGSMMHTVRTADGRYTVLRLTRKLAMAALCTECMGFEDNPADCTSYSCPLYPFRAKTLRTRRGDRDARPTPCTIEDRQGESGELHLGADKAVGGRRMMERRSGGEIADNGSGAAEVARTCDG